MTDGMTAASKDQERWHQILMLRLGIRYFALGDRSRERRDGILKAAKALDNISGKGYYSASTHGSVTRAEKKMDAIENNDRAVWAGLVVDWHNESPDFFSLTPEHCTMEEVKFWLSEDGWHAFRALSPLPQNKPLFFTENGAGSLEEAMERSRTLQPLVVAELERLGWRTHHDGAMDKYAVFLLEDGSMDIIWLGCGSLDPTNRGLDVRKGPEKSRIENPRTVSLF